VENDLSRRGLRPGLADGALPVTVSVAGQDNPLAGIEARLTQEMRDLAGVLGDFAGRTRLIREEIPATTASAEIAKTVTMLLELLLLQGANLLLQSVKDPILFDDGLLSLAKLGLSLKEFCQELTLNGKKFYLVASTDKLPDEHVDSREKLNAGTEQ
jgi:hypothetical protein